MNECVFCRIAAGEVPVNMLYQDDEIAAFHDLAPEAPVHFLVIPKKHLASIMDCTQDQSALLGRLLYRAQKLAADMGLSENGARFVINCKQHGGQTVPHLHVHVLGGRPLTWPPG